MRCLVILLASCSPLIAAPPKSVGDGFGVNKGLVLHLTFVKAGKQAIDKSSKKNHAAVHNAKFIAKGKFGGSYSLDGKGDYLRIANSSSIEIRNALTVALWVKLHSFNPKGYANENGYIVNKAIDLRTEFGEVSPDAAGVKSIVVTPKAKPPAVMTMQSGAVHRGEFVDKQLSMSLSPGGPTIKVSTAKIASITWAPPK